MTRQSAPLPLLLSLLTLTNAACITGRTIEHRPTPANVEPEAARAQITKMELIMRVLSSDWLEEETGYFGSGKVTFDRDRIVVSGDLVGHGAYCPFVLSAPIRPARWSLVEWGTGQYVSIPGPEVKVLESCALPMTPKTRLQFGAHEPDAGRRLMDLLATVARATR